MLSGEDGKVTLLSLWKQFLPLSVSDVTMAFGDPAVTGTLAQLPEARLNLAAVGVAKAIAAFFESPIIMILHASNSLASSRRARNALWRFTLVAMLILSGGLVLLSVPPIFSLVARTLFGLDQDLTARAGTVLLFLALWPAAIACRRYYQGLLIHYGHGSAVARAGFGRLFVVVGILAAGYALGFSGAILAGVALVGGVMGEALLVLRSARKLGVTSVPEIAGESSLPTDIRSVWRFYRPLASSMLVVWGGRALLIGLVARAIDGRTALAIWPAAWGLVLLIGNSTRMVQQVIIRNRCKASDSLLIGFAASVGIVSSLVLFGLAATTVGQSGVAKFLGGDLVLTSGVVPVLLLCAGLPLLVSLQNAVQGFLIGEGRTSRINAATWMGTTGLLATALIAINADIGGATAAALGMGVALVIETAWLAVGLWNRKSVYLGLANAS